MVKGNYSRYFLVIVFFILSTVTLMCGTGRASQSSQANPAEEIVSTFYSSKLADHPRTPTVTTKGSSQNPYPGFILKREIGNVEVESCVSLGGSCNQKVAEIIKTSDEYVVSFMYRYNSPAITNALADLHLSSPNTPVLVFLDYKQFYEAQNAYLGYNNYLVESVPTSLVKIGSKSFHHKIVVAKRKNEEAIVIVGSANATYESDNLHSEDLLIIRSNKLATIYLTEFNKMLNSRGVETYDVNKQGLDAPNRDFLESLTNATEESANENMSDIDTRSFTGTITSLAISSGTSSEAGSKACFRIFQDILKARNNLLIFFENYFTMGANEIPELSDKTPKLIILDDDPNNAKYLYHNLKERSNKALLFQLHTGGKFHHKLVLQYPYAREPVVYTGSFHPSTNAIKNNSENIIGIRSKELADGYLASILWQSGLGNVPEVWSFLEKFPEELGFKEKGSRLGNTITKLRNRAFYNIHRFWINTLPIIDYFSEALSPLFEKNLIGEDIDLLREEIEGNIQSFKQGYLTEEQLKGLEEIAASLNKMVFLPIWIEKLRVDTKYLLKKLPIRIDYYNWPFHHLSFKKTSLFNWQLHNNIAVWDLDVERMKEVMEEMKIKGEFVDRYSSRKSNPLIWDYHLEDFGIYYDKQNMLTHLKYFIGETEEALKNSLEETTELRECRSRLKDIKRLYEIMEIADNYEDNFDKISSLYLTLNDIADSSKEELIEKSRHYKEWISENPTRSKVEDKKRKRGEEKEEAQEEGTNLKNFKKQKQTHHTQFSRLVGKLKANKVSFKAMYTRCGISNYNFSRYRENDASKEAQNCLKLLQRKYKNKL